VLGLGCDAEMHRTMVNAMFAWNQCEARECLTHRLDYRTMKMLQMQS